MLVYNFLEKGILIDRIIKKFHEKIWEPSWKEIEVMKKIFCQIAVFGIIITSASSTSMPSFFFFFLMHLSSTSSKRDTHYLAHCTFKMSAAYILEDV